MRLSLLIAIAIVTSSIEARAKCAIVALVPKLLTAANTQIAPGGGVLVGLTYGGRDDRNDEVVEKKDWRFKRGGKLVEPTIQLLAPGLAT